ncbi:MAG: hypothetical protein ACRBCJ_01530 [Hyphomicrobiaceae bacterium]
MRNAMGNAMSNGLSAKRQSTKDQTDSTNISYTDRSQSIVITPQGRPADVEPRELPRCLRQVHQQPRSAGALTTSFKNTLGLGEKAPVVTRQLPTMTPLLPPPLPKENSSFTNHLPLRQISQFINSKAFKNLNFVGAVIAAGLTAAGVVTLYPNHIKNEKQSTQSNANTTTNVAHIARAGANAETSPNSGVAASPSPTQQAPTPNTRQNVEDLQLATSTAGDALEAPGENSGILAAVTHNFDAGNPSGKFEAIAASPTFIPTGPTRLIETLANPGSRPPVRIDAVIAAPPNITVTRGATRILPILLASPDYASKIRTLLITGLPKAAELSAASRDGLGGWVMVPEALGVAELKLPDEIEGTMEITIKAFGSSPHPVGITVMNMTITEAEVEPGQAMNAHKSIAEALVLYERGDVDGARALLSAIVDIGNPHAAYVFAETFDPAGLSERALSNTKADVERARFWYQRALKGGYTKASQRLANLPRISREVMVQDKSKQ